MSPTETVRTFYAALGRGDAYAALTLLSDKLEWTEADGFPYFSGTWRTPQKVLENLFVPLLKDWETFVADPDSFVSEASEVVKQPWPALRQESQLVSHRRKSRSHTSVTSARN